MTILRNHETTRDDFIFYSERLMRRTFEFALSFLPHKDTIITTPTGEKYEGKQFAGQERFLFNFSQKLFLILSLSYERLFLCQFETQTQTT